MSTTTASQFELSPPPTDAISALQFYHGTAPASDQSSSATTTTTTRLLVSSWDKHVYLYDTSRHQQSQQQQQQQQRPEEGKQEEEEDQQQGNGALMRKYEHRAPLLDVCFGKDSTEAFTAGLDWDVRRIDLETGEQTVLSTHKFGVRSVVYSSAHSLLISASWDKTLHVHDMSDPSRPPVTIPLPYKPFSISLTATKLVVAMAQRALHIYELHTLASLWSQAAEPSSSSSSPPTVDVEPWQRRESSLKFMTRAVACMPDDAGYASSSIEGRVAVEWFDPSGTSQARKYAFKCHRQTTTNNTAGDGVGGGGSGGAGGVVDVVYPVNALAFHPVHGTFASGGGDGIVALWDGIAKRRIKQYQRYPASIAALAFSADGALLAIASCPGFEDGKDDVDAAGAGQTKIFVKRLADNEAKAKTAK